MLDESYQAFVSSKEKCHGLILSASGTLELNKSIIQNLKCLGVVNYNISGVRVI